MASSRLIDFLRTERMHLIGRWQVRVVELLDTTDVSRVELLDHMPGFFDELLMVLEEYVRDAARNAPAPGRQPRRAGFDVDEVVREYGILIDVLLHALTKATIAFDPAELRVLLHRIDVGAPLAARGVPVPAEPPPHTS